MDAEVGVDEGVYMGAYGVTESGKTRAPDLACGPTTPRRDHRRSALGCERRELVEPNMDVKGREGMRSQVDIHIDIQEGAAWCATSLLVGQDMHPGVPESPLHIGLELLGGEACLCNLGAYGFNENPQALYFP